MQIGINRNLHYTRLVFRRYRKIDSEMIEALQGRFEFLFKILTVRVHAANFISELIAVLRFLNKAILLQGCKLILLVLLYGQGSKILQKIRISSKSCGALFDLRLDIIVILRYNISSLTNEINIICIS